MFESFRFVPRQENPGRIMIGFIMRENLKQAGLDVSLFLFCSRAERAGRDGIQVGKCVPGQNVRDGIQVKKNMFDILDGMRYHTHN